ncbi:MAG TPA: hypothetical protein VE988_25165, partial [Gemmataceae bacterium]|nr:hypothetical protein [Gemmataceae bacterium]
MLRQALLGLAVLLAGAGAPAYAQEVKLQLKFKEGETFWVEDVVTSKTNISLSGIPVDKTEQKITQVTSYTVKKVTAESVLME